MVAKWSKIEVPEEQPPSENISESQTSAEPILGIEQLPIAADNSITQSTGSTVSAVNTAKVPKKNKISKVTCKTGQKFAAVYLRYS